MVAVVPLCLLFFIYEINVSYIKRIHNELIKITSDKKIFELQTLPVVDVCSEGVSLIRWSMGCCPNEGK